MNTKFIATTLSLPSVTRLTRNKNTFRRIDPTVPELSAQVAWSKKIQSGVAATPKNALGLLSKKALAVTLVGLNLILFGAYLVGVNTYTTSGYNIKKLQTAISNENERTKQLNVKLSETNSLLGMKESFSELKFVPVNDATFLDTKHLSSR